MRALRYTESGGPEVLRYETVPDPEPGRRDVVVRVAYTSLNHLDVVQRNGWYHLPGFTFPHISGMDVAGEVVAVGPDVTRVALGDRVVVDPSLTEVPDGSKLADRGDPYGELGVIGGTVDGGYAELCLTPETHVYRLPDAMSYETAATFPTAWLTAWHALFTVGGLATGESVMIHAAGSGVSVAAIQLAKYVGATVLATAGSDAKLRRATELGADHVLNNRTGDITGWAHEVTGGPGVHLVLDHVGPALWAASMFALRPQGRLVNCGNTSGDTATIPSLGFLFHMGIKILGSDPYRYDEFGAAWTTFAGGSFQTPIDSVFPLADAAHAQEQMQRGELFGKILLRP